MKITEQTTLAELRVELALHGITRLSLGYRHSAAFADERVTLVIVEYAHGLGLGEGLTVAAAIDAALARVCAYTSAVLAIKDAR